MFRVTAQIKPVRGFGRALTVLGVVSASSLALAAPALAVGSPQAGTAAYDCGLVASEPHVSADGSEITGIGASLCLGTGWQDQKLVVTLEEQPFPTLYVVRAQASTSYSSSPLLLRTVSWTCTGSGTHPYTIETSWYGKNGSAYSYKFSEQTVSITCATR